MSKLDAFGELIREILTVAALEIFGGFEKTHAEYKEEISRSEEDMKRLQRLLDVVTQAEIKLHRTDVQQLSLPETPQIKEEQELWTSQEEEQLQGLKSETTDSMFTTDSNLHIRAFLSERLKTAASEIFGAIEITFAEYQEEISRSEKERKRIQRLFDVVAQPEIKLHRTEVQQLSILEPPQIKKEQELWTSQEEEQLQGLQSETTDSIFTSLSVKFDSDQDSSSECSHVDQTVKVEDREGDSLSTNTTEEQPLLETVKSSRKRKNKALPMEGTPQGSHTGEKPFQCLECKKRFSLKQTLLNHMIIHTGEKPYQCQECNNTFNKKSTLVGHMRTHTGEKPYHCPHCSKRFAKKSGLVEHIRTHTGEKPFQCQKCNNAFSQKATLVVHMRTHTGKKPCQCQECNKTFTQSGHLIRHMRTHTGEKPYQCQKCDKAFTERGNLVKHMRTHTGEKPFQCQECSKRFCQKLHLVEHIRTHTGEKPYQCHDCIKRFCSSSQLVKHMRTHRTETLTVSTIYRTL